MTDSNFAAIKPDFIEPLQAFLDGEHEGQTEQEISNDLLEMILSLARIRAGVQHKSAAEVAVFDQKFLKKLETLGSDNPELAVFENVMHRLTRSDPALAITYLNRSIEQKQHQISREQSRRARTPRKEHPLKTRLRNIISTKPNCSAKEYLRRLITDVLKNGQSMQPECSYCDKEATFFIDDKSASDIKCSTVTNKWVDSILNE